MQPVKIIRKKLYSYVLKIKYILDEEFPFLRNNNGVLIVKKYFHLTLQNVELEEG